MDIECGTVPGTAVVAALLVTVALSLGGCFCAVVWYWWSGAVGWAIMVAVDRVCVLNPRDYSAWGVSVF